MERISIHRVIPFEELESDLISVITKPRTLYSRGSWNKQDYLSVTVSGMSFNDAIRFQKTLKRSYVIALVEFSIDVQ